jgi:hypothetical protein
MLSDDLAGENYGLPTDYDNLDWDSAARLLADRMAYAMRQRVHKIRTAPRNG